MNNATSDTRCVADLEAQLEDEVQCSGVTGDGCMNPAALISYGHGCPSDYPLVKCMSCWQAWYALMVERTHKHGGFNICCRCYKPFYQISELSDYRPL